MPRPTLDTYFMQMAYHVASRSTCEEAQVGAVLVSSKNHILATGYNGGLPGQSECSGSTTCKLIRQRSNGERLELCPTIHSEANLLAQYRAAHNKSIAPPGSTVYCTTCPCLSCLQQLIQAKVSKVVFGNLNRWHQPTQFYKDVIRLEYFPLPQ